MMGGSATPLPLVNGQADEAARRSDRSAPAWEPIEARAFEQVAQLGDRARQLLDANRTNDAVQAIDEWVAASAAAHLAALNP